MYTTYDLHTRFVKACTDQDFDSVQTMLNYVTNKDICGENHKALRSLCKSGNIPIFKMVADKLLFTDVNIRANKDLLISAFIGGNEGFIKWMVKYYQLNSIDLRECTELMGEYAPANLVAL
jgi:hypothetical protein